MTIGIKIAVEATRYGGLGQLVSAFKTRVLADGGIFEGEANLLNQSLVAINDASFVYVPSAFKSGRLYSLKPTNGSGDLVFSRNSLAYRNNASNVLEQMAANVGRIHYIGGVPTLLNEPARTNLLLQSQTLNTTWAATRCTIVADTATAPNNTLTADKIAVSSTVGSKFISQTSNLVVGNIYTYSIFAKAVEENLINIEMGGGFVTQPQASFNLSLGTIVSANGCTAKITPYQNGWYRCEFTTTTLSNTTSDSFRIGIASASIVTGNGILVWGVQQELGSLATSYIPTTTAAVTRVADTNSVSRTFTQNQTLYQSIYLNAGSLSDGVFYCLFDIRGGASKRITISRFNNQLYLEIENSTLQFSGVVFTIPTLVQNTVYKLAITFTSTGFKVFVNGALRFTSSAISTPDLGAATLSIGCTNLGTLQYNGSLAENYIYDYTMTDAEAVAITT